MAWRVGIDIGGTFTDLALVNDERGTITAVKVPTTPQDFGAGVLDGLRSALGQHGVDPAQVGLLAHATTVVTNAILEKKGARSAIITTRGFRDVLELRRSSRPDLYDLFQDAPHVLIPRHRRLEITERIGAAGEVVTPLAEEEIPSLIEALARMEVEAIAVTLLFSFLNADHERRLGAALRNAFPDIPVYLSSEVLPEMREFERSSTTAVCAYVGPILGRYLSRLTGALESQGMPPLYVMASNGGLFEAGEGVTMPAMAIESGPAAGVVAAATIAEQIGERDLISFDMGGTTAKASLIRDARYETTPEYEVGGGASGNRWMHGTGHPIRVPVIDLAEVSSGGGSIAWVDAAGALRVGPHSAGADPGPVCYQRGGAEPTVTDCNLLLGYLGHGSLLGGEMEISHEAAERAVADRLAAPLGVDSRTAAAAVIDIVNHQMAEALKIVSVQRGHDPRDFTLAAFGGAGPLHAAALAEELGMNHVLCPPIPGAFSALGLIATDLKRDYVQTFYARSDQATAPEFEAAFRELEAKGTAMLARAGVPEARRRFERSVDARYRRQSYELSVPVPDPPFAADVVEEVAAAFHNRHLQTYGHENRSEPVQLVNLRLSAIGEIPSIRLRAQPAAEASGAPDSRMLWVRGEGEVSADVYRRDGLPAGFSAVGPVVIESLESTVLVLPGWTVRMDADGFLHLDRAAGKAGAAS